MKVTIAAITIALGLFLTPLARAQEPTPPGCQPLYNGGPVCRNSDVLDINKKILKADMRVQPGQQFNDADFVENIDPNGTRYTANTTTAFRIYLTNKTNSPLRNVVVKDIFPPRYITFVTGSGSYDSNSRTFSTTISELKANETRQITIQVMTARVDELPTDNQALCTINLAMATVNNKTSQDTSRICVAREANPVTVQGATASPNAPTPTNPQTTKGGLPVVSPVQPQPGQQTPQTGPEMLALAGLLPAGALGWLLRRKTS